MDILKKVFKEENLDKIQNDFFNSELPICWYPSSWYDFRHIFFWDYLNEVEGLKFPKIFIHTDYNCLNYNPFPEEYLGPEKLIYDLRKLPILNPLFDTGYILDLFKEKALITLGYKELFLKEDIFYPNRKILDNPRNTGRYTHRIFAIECQLIDFERDVNSLKEGDVIFDIYGESLRVIDPKCKAHHNMIRVLNEKNEEVNYRFWRIKFATSKKILILFFSIENSNFFYDVVLKNKLKINYLTHINDGGATMGGSKDKMDFIYLYSETLGLTKMIIDYTLEIKKRHIEKWSHYHYYNPKVRRKSLIKKQPEINIKQWKERKIFFPVSKGIYIFGKQDSGNRNWSYNYFTKAPLENEDKFKERIETYYFYEK